MALPLHFGHAPKEHFHEPNDACSRDRHLTFGPAAWAAPAGAQLMTLHPAQPEATGCKLVYGNGPLLQNVKVFDVFYSKGNTYRDMLTSYDTAITQSAYFDWLLEYDTGRPKIGHGSFLGVSDPSNRRAADGRRQDHRPRSRGLISAGNLPAPDDNKLYQMVYFPAGVDITPRVPSRASSSARTTAAVTTGSTHACYGVIPDVTAVAVQRGCGADDSVQQPHLGVVARAHRGGHRRRGRPDATSARSRSTPRAAAARSATSATRSRARSAGYTVQKEWSNTEQLLHRDQPERHGERLHGRGVADDGDGAAGRNGDGQVALTKTSGMAETATLTATTPTGKGLVASLSPTRRRRTTASRR